MASKFQNRLVGTIILVSACVIFLPGLLDGKKKHYKEQFAAIPLVPKAGDMLDNEQVPPITQPLVNDRIQEQTVPPRSGKGNRAITPSEESVTLPSSTPTSQENQTASVSPTPPTVVSKKPATERVPEVKQPQRASQSTRKEREQEEQRAMALLTGKGSTGHAPVPPSPSSKGSREVHGQQWVLQLAVLSNANAERVRDIVQKLQAAGFPAFSKPAVPVAGKTTYILVGPDKSQANLVSQRQQIKTKFNLGGYIRSYPLR